MKVDHKHTEGRYSRLRLIINIQEGDTQDEG